MDAQQFPRISASILLFFCMWLAACTPAPAPTPYIPPSPVPSSIPPVPPTITPVQIVPTTVCANDLTFLEDVTIPDNTFVAPGENLDKQWLIQNSGSCDWNKEYRLKFIGGALMEATAEQALVPARAGKEAVIRIVFTAPQDAGQYVSLWQAYDPFGMPFGEQFQMTVVVQP